VVDIVPEQALHLLADGNQALLVAFTQDFQHAVIELQIGELQSEEFGDPQPGIEQGQDDRIVALPLGVAGIHGIEQQLDLRGRERGHDFFRYFGDFHPLKRVRRDDFFRDQPGKENPDAADVTIDAVLGEQPILDTGRRMIREKRLLLQVEDEGADLLRADRGDVRAGAVRQQEFAEIADAVGDDLDRS
jgi:hypothetical protein